MTLKKEGRSLTRRTLLQSATALTAASRTVVAAGAATLQWHDPADWGVEGKG